MLYSRKLGLLLSSGAVVACALLMSNCTEITTIIDEYGPDTGGVVLQDTSLIVNPSTDTVRIAFDKVEIKIPKGSVPDGTELKIVEFDSSEEEALEDYDFGPIYDITLEGYTDFIWNLHIHLDFNNEQISEAFEKALIPVYYDEKLKKWRRFQDYDIDTVNNQVVIFTKHLTKLSWFSPKRLSGYTDYYQGAFTIYYDISKIPSNSSYISPNAGGYSFSSYPHYILDLDRYFNEALSMYRSRFSDWRDRNFEVYIHSIPQNGYVSPPLNSIHITNDLNHKVLRSTCAHELFHVVQDNYYSQLGLIANNIPGIDYWKWWWEATAVNADRLVWINLAVDEYEAPYYANTTLSYNMEKAWDDCPDDPMYYSAGGFFVWLSWYRGIYNQRKIVSLDSLVRYVGTHDQFSTIRESANNFIHQSVGKSLGEEFQDYLRWAFSGGIVINLASSFIPSTDDKWQEKIRLTNSDMTQTVVQSIPNIGARVFKVYNYFDPSDSVQLEILDLGSDVEAIVYRVKNPGKNDEKKEGLGPLLPGEKKSYRVESTEECLDVLCTNKNLNDRQNIELKMTSLLDIKGFSISLNVNTPANERIWLIQQVKYQWRPDWLTTSQEGLTFTGTYTTASSSGNSSVEIEFNQEVNKIISFKLIDNDRATMGEKITTEIELKELPLTEISSGTREFFGSGDVELSGFIQSIKQDRETVVYSGFKNGTIRLKIF